RLRRHHRRDTPVSRRAGGDAGRPDLTGKFCAVARLAAGIGIALWPLIGPRRLPQKLKYRVADGRLAETVARNTTWNCRITRANRVSLAHEHELSDVSRRR